MGAHGGGRHSGLDWSCPHPGLAATPSPACSTHQGCRSQVGHTHTQPGTRAHGTATTHSSACSEGQNQTPSAAPAALLPWLSWHSGHSVTLLPPVHPCTAPREDKKAFRAGPEVPQVSKPGLQGPRGLAVARKEQGWQLSHSACPQPINLSRGQGSHGRIILFAGAKPQLWGINAGGYIKERGAGTRQCSASDPSPPPRVHPGTRRAEHTGDIPSPQWTKQCQPASWLTNSMDAWDAQDCGILPCHRARDSRHGAGAISQLSAGANREALGQRKLQEPWSQDGAWDLGAGSHQAATDGPTPQETAPATRLPPA